ncbi:MAG TPA: hypothetical protein VFT04_05640 [Gemmatimonadales bacterium]|nr:hypothetical protein [Gemmatimonadales bacterium]
MARRPTWLAWILGTAGATAVLAVADRISHDPATSGGWRMTLSASALYGGALVGLGMILLARTRTWQGAALLAAIIVWAIGWLAPALAVAPIEESGSALVMVGTGLLELPVSALIGLWIFLRCAGWQHPRADASAGREARRTA